MPNETHPITSTEPAVTGTPPLDSKSRQILDALAEVGDITAGNLAEHTGIAYPTTTKKLRNLNSAGLADSRKADNGQIVWYLTNADQPGTGTATDAAAMNNTEPDRAPQNPAPDATNAGAAAKPEPEPAAATVLPPDVLDDEPPASDTDEARQATAPASEGALDDPTVEPGEVPFADEAMSVPAPPTADAAVAATGTAAGNDAGDAEADTITGGEPAAPAAESAPPVGGQPPRRASGELDRSILAILQAHPEQKFKVSELCRLIDKADAGTGVPKASAGAVVLSGQRLERQGLAVLAAEHPVSFQVAADTGATDPAGPAPALTSV